jgi:hypothetical protein
VAVKRITLKFCIEIRYLRGVAAAAAAAALDADAAAALAAIRR